MMWLSKLDEAMGLLRELVAIAREIREELKRAKPNV